LGDYERFTYFAAMPVAIRDAAVMVEDRAIQCCDADHAISTAMWMACEPGFVGARAFSRTGDPTTGRFEPAEVLRRFGGVG
jgi:hypothetical protein